MLARQVLIAVRLASIVALVPGSARALDAVPDPAPQPAPHDASEGARAAENIEPAPLIIFVNGQPLSAPATVLLRGADALVLRSDLENARLRNLPASSDLRIGGQRYVSLAGLAPWIAYRIDERSLELHITAPAAYFDRTVLDLSPHAPANMVQHRDTGLFVNYAPRLVDLRTLGFSGEVGASVAGRLFYSGVAYDVTNHIVRGLTNLTIDEPQAMRRWVVGDSFALGGGPTAGSVFLGGISVGRAFQLNPYFVRFATPATVGAALTPSTMDVYVNGVLLSRIPVAPGEFRIQNIPASSGTGNVRYVLRDAFGREQDVVSSFYASAGVLARGVSDYGVALGAVRNRFGVESWDYGPLATLARYRVGLTDAITVGAHVQAPLPVAHMAASAGLGATLLAALGQVDGEVGASVAPGGQRGAAGALSYLYRAGSFAGGLSVRTMSDGYTTLALTPLDAHARWASTAFVSVSPGPRVTLTSAYTLGLARDGAVSGSISEQIACRLTNDVQVSATVSRTRYEDGTAPFAMFVNLNVALGASVFGSASALVAKRQSYVGLDLSKPLPVGTGYSLHASAREGATRTLAGAIEAQNAHGRVRLELVSAAGERHGSISAAGGIVVVPGAGFFFTRPVQDGYAVVHVAGASNVRSYLNNNEIGRTNAAGDLVVPNLIPYYGNRLSVNDKDLPLDYRIDEVAEVVATPFRGPAVVSFVAKRTSFVRGNLVVRPRAGEDVVPAYGEVKVSADRNQLTSPIARGGEFEFEGLDSGEHALRIDYAEGACDMQLFVPIRIGPIVDLGTVVCLSP